MPGTGAHRGLVAYGDEPASVDRDLDSALVLHGSQVMTRAFATTVGLPAQMTWSKV